MAAVGGQAHRAMAEDRACSGSRAAIRTATPTVDTAQSLLFPGRDQSATHTVERSGMVWRHCTGWKRWMVPETTSNLWTWRGGGSMPYYMYISLQDDDKIRVFTMDAATGQLAPKSEVPVSGGPSPLALSPDRTVLYVGHRNVPGISSFRIDPDTGGLTQS